MSLPYGFHKREKAMLKLNNESRFELPVIDGPTAVTVPKRKPASPAKRTTKAVTSTAAKPEPATTPKPTANLSTVRWATFGVVFMCVLSAGLNGYANAQHSPIAILGWMMGVSIPVIVLTLAKVCGEKYRDGQRSMAYLAGGSGVALLVLSVWHCAESIAIITGSPVLLAFPLALAIDAGLISCELALISEPRE